MLRSRKGPKTGRSDTPVKGVTITVRGPFQFQASFRRTGYRCGAIAHCERAVEILRELGPRKGGPLDCSESHLTLEDGWLDSLLISLQINIATALESVNHANLPSATTFCATLGLPSDLARSGRQGSGCFLATLGVRFEHAASCGRCREERLP
jgi:hypothetical protein